MSATVQIKLTPQAAKLVAGLQTLPAQVVAAVARGMDYANQLALAKVKQRLVGTGPFPPSEHRLGRRSGSLFAGVHASPAEVDGQKIVSAIGTNTTNKGFSYAALHEFGGRVQRKGREHKVRLKVDARGNLVRQAGHSHLAVFARSNHRRAVERTGHSKDHTAEYPERAPFRTGIAEAAPGYSKSISRAIVEAFGKLSA